MKKLILLAVTVMSGVILFTGFTSHTAVKGKSKNGFKGIVIDIPDNVQAVLDQSCVACHSDNASNAKAKLALNFAKFESGEYSAGKIVGKLNNIIKVLDEGSMPTKRFLEKYPDKKLSDEQVVTLKDWANKNLKKFSDE